MYLNNAQPTTWSHLQCIAAHYVEEGGLGLFQEGSRQFRAVFSQVPGTSLEGGPESGMNFPRVLRGGGTTREASAAHRGVRGRELLERAREEEGPGGPEDGIEARATDRKHVQGELDHAATGRQERQERPISSAVRSVE